MGTWARLRCVPWGCSPCYSYWVLGKNLEQGQESQSAELEDGGNLSHFTITFLPGALWAQSSCTLLHGLGGQLGSDYPRRCMRHGIHTDSLQLELERNPEWRDPLLSEKFQNSSRESLGWTVWIFTKPGSHEALVDLQGNSKLFGSLLSTSWQLPKSSWRVLCSCVLYFHMALPELPPLNRPSFHN